MVLSDAVAQQGAGPELREQQSLNSTHPPCAPQLHRQLPVPCIDQRRDGLCYARARRDDSGGAKQPLSWEQLVQCSLGPRSAPGSTQASARAQPGLAVAVPQVLTGRELSLECAAWLTGAATSRTWLVPVVARREEERYEEHRTAHAGYRRCAQAWRRAQVKKKGGRRPPESALTTEVLLAGEFFDKPVEVRRPCRLLFFLNWLVNCFTG